MTKETQAPAIKSDHDTAFDRRNARIGRVMGFVSAASQLTIILVMGAWAAAGLLAASA
ncbi:MAG: hypothetical protein AAGK00_20720 [Pseudomonadota bacterium]